MRPRSRVLKRVAMVAVDECARPESEWGEGVVQDKDASVPRRERGMGRKKGKKRRQKVRSPLMYDAGRSVSWVDHRYEVGWLVTPGNDFKSRRRVQPDKQAKLSNPWIRADFVLIYSEFIL